MQEPQNSMIQERVPPPQRVKFAPVTGFFPEGNEMPRRTHLAETGRPGMLTVYSYASGRRAAADARRNGGFGLVGGLASPVQTRSRRSHTA